MKSHFYDVYLNGAKLVTAGPHIFGLFISFSADRDENKVYLRAEVTRSESGNVGTIEWLDKEISHTDSIKISLSQDDKASKPIRTREYLKGADSCGFCTGNENDVGSLIKLGNSPYICLGCLKICIKLLEPNEHLRDKPFHVIEKELFYDIYINEAKVATVGPHTNSLYVSFGAFEDKSYLSASATYPDEPGMVNITEWLHKEINYSDLIQISPSPKDKASDPFRTKKHKISIENKKSEEITREDNTCDFCKNIIDEAGSLIKVNYAPQICRNCINLCIEILKDKQ